MSGYLDNEVMQFDCDCYRNHYRAYIDKDVGRAVLDLCAVERGMCLSSWKYRQGRC